MHEDHAQAGPHAQEANPAASGTLVIRTWLEHGEVPPGFRARITYGPAAGAEHVIASVADPDGVLNVVRQWLQTQAAAQGRG
jgi:hypothetical protein